MTTHPKPYFSEGSDAMLALDAMVERVGVRNVLYALGYICTTKAKHIRIRHVTVAPNSWDSTASAVTRLADRL